MQEAEQTLRRYITHSLSMKLFKMVARLSECCVFVLPRSVQDLHLQRPSVHVNGGLIRLLHSWVVLR